MSGRTRSQRIYSTDNSARSSPSHDMEDPITSSTLGLELMHALKSPDVARAIRDAIVPELIRKIGDLENTVVNLLDLNRKKDEVIAKLQTEVETHEMRFDELEQQGRKSSVRIFGVPEDATASLDDVALQIFKDKMGANVDLVDLEVVHRVGKTAAAATTVQPGAPPPRPRAILVKFTSRRVKGTVMARGNRARLKHTGIVVADDLTKRRAQIAFKARKLRQEGKVSDTWVFNGKILVKDLAGTVKEVRFESELPT